MNIWRRERTCAYASGVVTFVVLVVWAFTKLVGVRIEIAGL
jgi:hypothetical protein